ncbi:bZIP transcription factor 27 [Capsicum annuum]|uniref:bZIP transcription factor 27 n=1 Tax=Capsicum annuum TaxID=4072 RepID=UPI001FB05033|nr:bZIP transcription factor 27 [Capsicum annuum]
MRSSSSEEHQQLKGLDKNLATYSSKSSSPSSSTSSSNNYPINPVLINSKTMEEVWKDINLSSLNDHTCSRAHMDPQSTTASTINFGGMILQDLLARPLASDPPTATTAYGSPVPPPPPVTMLTLNSGPELHFFSSLNPLRKTSICLPKNISNSSTFEALASPAAGRNANGKKRHPESDNHSGDQKNKRMIKNRESAARSRARKQAYTNELEQEVANLMEENARLKRQQQQLCLASAGAQLPRKNSLYRTSTAPF